MGCPLSCPAPVLLISAQSSGKMAAGGTVRRMFSPGRQLRSGLTRLMACAKIVVVLCFVFDLDRKSKSDVAP